MTNAAVGWLWSSTAWWAFGASPPHRPIDRWYGPLKYTDSQAANKYADIQESNWNGHAYAWKWNGSSWDRKW